MEIYRHRNRSGARNQLGALDSGVHRNRGESDARMITPSDFESNIADEIEALIQDTSSTAVINSNKEMAKAARSINELSALLKHFVESGCRGCK